MSVFAVLHANRVIMAQTILNDPSQFPGFTLEPWPIQIPPEAGPRANGTIWLMRPNGTVRPATEEEIDTSGADDVRNQAKRAAQKQELIDAGRAVLDDPTVPDSVKRFVRAMRALI